MGARIDQRFDISQIIAQLDFSCFLPNQNAQLQYAQHGRNYFDKLYRLQAINSLANLDAFPFYGIPAKLLINVQ